MRNLRTLTWAFGAVCLAAACAPEIQGITIRVAPAKIAPDPEKVTVVVVQPEADLRVVDLVDGRGQLVGQLDERTHTVLRLPEGPTLLYAVAENAAATADRLEGTLVAGRVYYATVSKRPGGVALLALNPRSPGGRWSHRDEYLAKTTRVEMDTQRVVRAANDLGDTTPLMQAGDARFSSLAPADQAEHTIQESDGF
jgi:hypothetical protein